jgi:hypothetical protein
MPVEFIALLVLAALSLVLCGYAIWALLRQVDRMARLLASRSYTDFAKGEKTIAQKDEPESTVRGDGYTQLFE